MMSLSKVQARLPDRTSTSKQLWRESASRPWHELQIHQMELY